MIRIVESGKLGEGQAVEKRMAEDLGIEVVEIDWVDFDVTKGGEEVKHAATIILEKKLREQLGDID